MALGPIGALLMVFSTQVNLLNGLVLFSASDKAKLFAKNFSRNPYLEESGILYLLPLLELIAFPI